MGENAYVLGGAPAVVSHKRRWREIEEGKSSPKNLVRKKLKALRTKTAPLGKAGLLINLAHWPAGISQGQCQPHQMGGNGLKLAMAAIAKRLFGTFATGTPEIGFAFFNFDWHW